MGTTLGLVSVFTMVGFLVDIVGATAWIVAPFPFAAGVAVEIIGACVTPASVLDFFGTLGFAIMFTP
jgi:hypothetical protein